MMPWLPALVWVVWLALAAILAIAEMATLDFTLLMLSGGALVGCVVALAFPDLVWLQILVAVLAAVVLLWVLRPTLLHKVRSMPGYRSSLSKLVGSTGQALTDITSTSGEVKLGGEVWTARPADGSAIPRGADVEVYRIDGAVAIVFPRNLPIPGGESYWARPE